jgi:hypothetical protein
LTFTSTIIFSQEQYRYPSVCCSFLQTPER